MLCDDRCSSSRGRRKRHINHWSRGVPTRTKCGLVVKDAYTEIGNENSQFDVNRNGIHSGKSSLDRGLKRAVSAALKDRIVHVAYYPMPTGHPGGSRVYQTVRKDFSSPSMASYIFQTARECRSCTAMRSTPLQHVTPIKLFRASGLVELVAMDILRPLPKSVTRLQYVLVNMDRFSKPTRTIPMRNTTAPKLADVFLSALL